MKLKKKIISIEGTIINKDYSEIDYDLYRDFEDKFFELVNSFDFGFYGAMGLITERELEEIQNR